MHTNNHVLFLIVICVNILCRFLISLCNPLDKQNTELMTHTGLSLLTVVFEVTADSIGKYNVLLTLVKDDLCKNLFGVRQYICKFYFVLLIVIT